MTDTHTTAGDSHASPGPSSDRAMRVKRCAECDAVFDGADWHPVALIEDGGTEGDLVEFCSNDCKRSFLAETA